MNTENWEKIEEIVSEALILEGKERQDYLNHQCENLSELREEVESLLQNENEADDFFDSAATFKYSSLFKDDKAEASVGQQIGNYQILREIGTGGMGAVYLAERTDGEFDQKVAIKMLRREFNTSEIRRRFEYEKEIQAKLVHTNIARLIDAGTTNDGIPYIVMEYIEGENITNFCRRKNLLLEERLKLFNKVCDAVAFAHRNLIIHRDLKPSNIIVTKDGNPKLLDFGISKLLTENFNETQTVTKLGVMTPEYASPEQAKGKSVTTATDIYSLGVILFELLTGYRPFENEFRESGNVFKAIIEKEPERPSNILGKIQLWETPQINTDGISENKENFYDEVKTHVLEEVKTQELISKTVPQFTISNPKQLRGDLDNIILKALRKEPERRYQTVEQFSADIWRHLDGMPVSARPATFSYRTSKFVKRNKVGVIASGLIIMAIIAGLITTFWQAKRAERRFNEVRSLANSFLFEITPEIEKLPGSTRAKELVVKRALEYLDNLSDEAGDDVELQRELAAAYEKVGSVQGNPLQNNIGDIEGAKKSYEKAQTILEHLLERSPDDLRLKSDLAKVLKLSGDVLFWAGDIETAEIDFRKSLELQEQIVSDTPNDLEAQQKLGEVILDLGYLEFWKGDLKKSRENYERSRMIFEKLHKENQNNYKITEQMANTYVRLGEVTGWEEKFEKAGELLDKGLNLLKEISKENSKDLQTRRTLMAAYMRRAENFSDLKQYDKSVEFYRESVNIAKTALNEDPENARAKRDLALLKFKVAEALDLSGKSLEGLESLKEVLEIQNDLAESDPRNIEHLYDIAKTNNTVGEAYYKLKNYDLALESFQKSLKSYHNVIVKDPKNSKAKRGIGITRQNIGRTYSSLASSKKQRNLYKSALDNYKQSLEILTELKKESALAELDNGLIIELERQINETQSKIK